MKSTGFKPSAVVFSEGFSAFATDVLGLGLFSFVALFLFAPDDLEDALIGAGWGYSA